GIGAKNCRVIHERHSFNPPNPEERTSRTIHTDFDKPYTDGSVLLKLKTVLFFIAHRRSVPSYTRSIGLRWREHAAYNNKATSGRFEHRADVPSIICTGNRTADSAGA